MTGYSSKNHPSLLRSLRREGFIRRPHPRRKSLLREVPYLTVPSAFLRYFGDRDDDAALTVQSLPAPAWLHPGPPLLHPSTSLFLHLFRNEKPTRSASSHHYCTFLINLTQWNYLSAHVWAMSMTHSVNPSMVKIFHQNETCQGDTICFPSHSFFFFLGGSSSKFRCNSSKCLC